MKKIFLLVVLALALPLAAMADDVTFTNMQGTLGGNSHGFTLTNGVLSSVTGLDGNGPINGNLGSVTFATSTLRDYSNVNDGGHFNPGGT